MFRVRKDIIDFFEKGIFSFKGNVFKTKEEKSEEKLKKYINDTFTFIEEKSKGIINDLFTKCFNFLKPIDLANKLYGTKDKKKSNELVGLIKVRWSYLKNETEKMFKEEI